MGQAQRPVGVPAHFGELHLITASVPEAEIEF
jgi:hypothetical protein